MYPVNDDDLMLLECYLDDALSDAEVSELRVRLAAEPELAAALRQLRDERSQRQVFFQAIDPSAAEAENLAASIRATSRRKVWWQDHRKVTRIGSAIAACVVLAITASLFIPQTQRGVAPAAAPAAVASKPGEERAKYAVDVTDDTGKVIAVQHFDSPNDANDFASDLRQMHHRRQQQATPNNGVMLIKNNDF